MADLSITIANVIGTVGVGAASIWGVMEWGDPWGSSSDLPQHVEVAPDMADLVLTDSLAGKDINHLMDGETLVLTDSVGKEMERLISNSLVMTEDLSEIIKSLGGWDYIFTLPTTDGRDKGVDDLDQVEGIDDDFASVAGLTDNWS